jgi:hypothetical protein
MHTMKTIHVIFVIFGCFAAEANAQRVGIGTETPSKLLSVNGSILLDQGNMNSASVDSAALRFGTTTLVGISSNRNPGFQNHHGLDLWTNGIRRVSILNNGRVGINTTSPGFTFDVNGSANVGYLYTGGIYSTGSITSEFDLNANDDLSVGDDATILGNLGVGGAYNSSYRLRVEGNGLFTTNVGIDGTLRVDGKITNDGKAIMKSNSSTTLRSGFSSGTFTYSMGAGGSAEIEFCITSFTGNNTNVRVMVAQFIPGSGASANAGSVTINVIETIASGGACGNGSSAIVKFSNTTSSTMNLGSNAVLYLYTVVTD